MSVQLDAKCAHSGTRFLVFAQPRYLESFRDPETIHLAISPSEIQAGPADQRMYVLDAIDKRPYSRFSPRPFKTRNATPQKM